MSSSAPSVQTPIPVSKPSSQSECIVPPPAAASRLPTPPLPPDHPENSVSIPPASEAMTTSSPALTSLLATDPQAFDIALGKNTIAPSEPTASLPVTQTHPAPAAFPGNDAQALFAIVFGNKRPTSPKRTPPSRGVVTDNQSTDNQSSTRAQIDPTIISMRPASLMPVSTAQLTTQSGVVVPQDQGTSQQEMSTDPTPAEANYKHYLSRMCLHNMQTFQCDAQICYLLGRGFTCPDWI